MPLCRRTRLLGREGERDCAHPGQLASQLFSPAGSTTPTNPLTTSCLVAASFGSRIGTCRHLTPARGKAAAAKSEACSRQPVQRPRCTKHQASTGVQVTGRGQWGPQGRCLVLQTCASWSSACSAGWPRRPWRKLLPRLQPSSWPTSPRQPWPQRCSGWPAPLRRTRSLRWPLQQVRTGAWSLACTLAAALQRLTSSAQACPDSAVSFPAGAHGRLGWCLYHYCSAAAPDQHC